MDYPSLLLYLENQLKWLQKKNCNYLNQETLPKVELCELVDGLYELMPHMPSDTGREMHFGELPQHLQERSGQSLQHLKQQLKMSCAQAKIDAQEQHLAEADTPPSAQVPLFRQPTEAPRQRPPEGPLIAQADSLTKLFQQHCECQRCPLGPTRTQFVFGVGGERSSIFFVGEGPGAEEDRQGEPFVGKAGQLLTKMIESIGIARADVYISNVVKCRPPGNRNPHSEEITQCLPILQRQIELVNPKLIVTLGNVPTQALLPGSPGITKMRGNIHHYQQWPVLPTFHPSYLLRNRSALPAAWDDFQQITQLVFAS